MKRPREAAADVPDADGLTVLHRVRASSKLVPWHVAAVTCIAACPDGSVFAAGYDDGKVEVFDGALFNCLARIPGSDGSEISSIAWARAPRDAHWRLFASTLDGSLLELSCQQLQPIAATDSFGGAIWCMRPAPAAAGVVTQLAAACGDGSVKLFAVHGAVAGAEYVKSLPRVEGNVLALAWHPDGRSIVSGGSDGCIHCWDVQRGTERQRITVGTSSAVPPCVWSLTVLRDGTIVSGDGDGAVQFWDGRFGTLLARHQQFAADVLALAASPDGASVWASGVDPRVALFHLVPDKATGAPHWVFLDRKQPHTHDVRSLTPLLRPDSDPLLLSGGNDGQLVLYSLERFLKEHPTRQSKSPQRPLLQLAAGLAPARLLHVQGRTLSLWQLGRAVRSQALAGGDAAGAAKHFEGDHWDLAALPSQLASITTRSSSHIAAAALSPDGSAVAAADRGRLRLFRLVAAAAAADVTAYSAETGMPTQWTLKNHSALAELLQQLPGSIQGLSFRPTPAEPLSLLVHSAGGLCHIDMAAGLSLHKPDTKQPRTKRNAALSKPEACSELGRNGRLLKLQHSCLLLGHTSASEALLLEKPWAEQLQTLLPPLYRHRYGT
ncbi:hypothetical protein OEZ85_012193 [Tetradesmus obliquus]|uniref:Anaphase-promoting complex subunit 4 WD40 domain-containing protein n=1 Tax=Tetradesmus obliquus TaxID=3088 RepID=A0ABY8TSQ9_TETOB|nr:hypothetical protein OEZ85_012193 [Tetradesmus obliquus]